MNDDDIEHIETKWRQLQEQGKFLEALPLAEQVLSCRRGKYDSDSKEVQTVSRAICELCNLVAMSYLNVDDYQQSMNYLKKAEEHGQDDDANMALTYNNYACFYRRRNELTLAMEFLEKTLRIETSMTDNSSHQADTHLNMCAVLSQLGQHSTAIQHAQLALSLLEETFADIISNTGNNQSQGNSTVPVHVDRIAALAIAYHNIGTEQEYMGSYHDCRQSYRRGAQIAKQYLGDGHSILKALQKSLSRVNKTQR